MQADYTKQLDEIVRILSKPSTPTWVVSLVSMGFGVVGTLIALLVGDFYKRYKLRRVLYGNLISLFQELSAILEFQTNG